MVKKLLAIMLNKIGNSSFLAYSGTIPKLNGATVICDGLNTYNYTVQYANNILGATNVTWRISKLEPNLILEEGDSVGQIISSTGNTSTLLTSGSQTEKDGLHLLEANLIRNGRLITTVFETLWNDKPIHEAGTYIDGSNEIYLGSSKTFNAPILHGATYFRWKVSSGLSITSGQGSKTALIKGNQTGSKMVEVRAENNCGNSFYQYKYVEVVSQGGGAGGGSDPCLPTLRDISFFPNPSKDSYV